MEELWTCITCSANVNWNILFNMYENIWPRWNVSLSDTKGCQSIRRKRNWAEQCTKSSSSMKSIFKLHLYVMTLQLLLLKIHTSHFVSTIAADRSFPWFSHFSLTSQARGLFFPSLYCPGPPSAQTGCSVSLGRYKIWAVKASSTHFFTDSPSATIQPPADELRFAWNLPPSLYTLLWV